MAYELTTIVKPIVTLLERQILEEEIFLEMMISPGSPGRTTGPIEKCYPPEPPEAWLKSAYVHRFSTKKIFENGNVVRPTLERYDLNVTEEDVCLLLDEDWESLTDEAVEELFMNKEAEKERYQEERIEKIRRGGL